MTRQGKLKEEGLQVLGRRESEEEASVILPKETVLIQKNKCGKRG